MLIRFVALFIFVAGSMNIPARAAYGQETVTVALTSKAFQYTILLVAQERGYMKEEGIDLKIVYMQNAPGLQALSAGSVQFSGSGSSTLVATSKGGAPFKTVIAANDQVLQWVVARPNISSIKDLKDNDRSSLDCGLHVQK
jgi:ABC-type nitrate/sulfonate/bicarbonate transport system substrate-binding protein